MSTRSDVRGLADLIVEVTNGVSCERGVVCAVDCLRQLEEGGEPLLHSTMDAWKRYLSEVETHQPQTEQYRHHAYVPAIPF